MLFDFGIQSLLRINSHLRIGSHISPPKLINSVITINHKDEINPQDVNITDDAREAIWQSVINLYNTGTHPGISLCMRKQGKIIINRSIGHARGNGPGDIDLRKVLMTPETPTCYFSGSKAITAFLIHLLDEDKRINLHDPIGHYLPEFIANGKQNVSIYQLLTHRSGLLLPKVTNLDKATNKKIIWQEACSLHVKEKNIGRLAYQAISTGFILEKIIQTVTGKEIQQFLDERVRQPMQMRYFQYGTPEADKKQVSTNYTCGIPPIYPLSKVFKQLIGGSLKAITHLSNTDRFNDAVIPAANLTGTAEEMGRFYQMLLNEGIWQGKQICQPVTVQRFIQPHGDTQFDHNLKFPMRYSPGLMLGSDPVGLWGQNSGQSFGHIGLINKLFWADKKRDITVSLSTTGMPVIANHMPALMYFIAKVNQCS